MNDIDLGEVITFVATAHEGQKYGKVDFITHPLMVAMALTTPTEKIVGLLHDVVEDTSVTIETIQKKYGAEIAEAVDLLTRRENEEYMHYIAKLSHSRLATEVKVSDLNANLFFATTGFFAVKGADEFIHLIPRYKEALEFLIDIKMIKEWI